MATTITRSSDGSIAVNKGSADTFYNALTNIITQYDTSQIRVVSVADKQTIVSFVYDDITEINGEAPPGTIAETAALLSNTIFFSNATGGGGDEDLYVLPSTEWDVSAHKNVKRTVATDNESIITINEPAGDYEATIKIVTNDQHVTLDGFPNSDDPDGVPISFNGVTIIYKDKTSGIYTYLSNGVAPDADVPQITLQPSPQTINAGENIELTVDYTANPAATVQWQKGGVDISGATNKAYSKLNAVSADSGNYRAAVTNSVGTVYSDVVAVSVVEDSMFVNTMNVVSDETAKSLTSTGVAPSQGFLVQEILDGQQIEGVFGLSSNYNGIVLGFMDSVDTDPQYNQSPAQVFILGADLLVFSNGIGVFTGVPPAGVVKLAPKRVGDNVEIWNTASNTLIYTVVGVLAGIPNVFAFIQFYGSSNNPVAGQTITGLIIS